MRPHGTLIFVLDGVLSNLSDSHGPIGEPIDEAWVILEGALNKGYRVVVSTYRDPSQVAGWLHRAKLAYLLNRSGFQIEQGLPSIIPVGMVSHAPLTLNDVRHLR